MSRQRKRDLLKAVNALIKTNDSVSRSKLSDAAGMQSLLAQCQETAIQLGTFLETLDKKYELIIGKLEDYCEIVYRMSRNLSEEQSLAIREKEHRKQAKRIRGLLTEIRNSIVYGFPEDRREVVFLPYKASMWDSLESIWRAAEADENTDAYVIPIPYYDKNPDESFREEHYEGGLYPDYVPITRYDEYDFEERRPDAIFIHNAYDDWNNVTSVHPFFYSENLKHFTRQLVYIPYFILGEVNPENHDQVEKMKHFCTIPGVINADKVIVQSENMRKAYINVLREFAAQQGLGEIDWESKILALGSPKIDKVLHTRKEDLEIPEEWQKLIQKPDGRWKKVVFYNTSVNGLLQYGERMLEKIRNVLELFQYMKDEAVLLWRPHPLMLATIRSMRPKLLDEYIKMTEEYRSMKYGIYDDSSDIDRAVVLCDAYYGDASSIVYMCQKAGKPVMIQNVEVGMRL